MDQLRKDGVEGIVIDLRNNGGGSLTEAISLTGLFINKGPVVQVKESEGDVEVQADTDPMIAYDGPLAVMVNRFSASASEIFAAAIQDYKRGVIVGEQTYGKGTVQTLIELNKWMPKESAPLGEVKMTVAKFYRVNGSSTQLRGVTPDLELPTPYKADEYGEASQPSALPWDQIPSARYEMTDDISDKMVAQLRDKHTQRLKSDEELKKLVQDMAAFRKAREDKMVSLQIDKRRKERAEAEKKRAALKDFGDEAEDDEEIESDSTTVAKATPAAKKKDIYLTETSRIVADLVTIANEPALVGTKKKR